MGESKMKYISAILFEHMKIGMLLCNKPNGLALDDISIYSQRFNIPTTVITLALKDLVAHGIISVKFKDNYELNYIITEFGSYFFKELCSKNEDAATIFKKVGVIINETDDT